jgi:hypothetical protein
MVAFSMMPGRSGLARALTALSLCVPLALGACGGGADAASDEQTNEGQGAGSGGKGGAGGAAASGGAAGNGGAAGTAPGGAGGKGGAAGGAAGKGAAAGAAGNSGAAGGAAGQGGAAGAASGSSGAAGAAAGAGAAGASAGGSGAQSGAAGAGAQSGAAGAGAQAGAGGAAGAAQGGAGGVAQGGAAGASGSAGAAGCSPACGSGEICSGVGECIPMGTCKADGDCTGGTVCDIPTGKCVPGSACGVQKLQATVVPPNMLIVQDRSCSMTGKVAGVSKWQIAVDAIKGMTTTFAGKIRFGLTLFPDLTGNNCAQDAPFLIPVAPNTEAKIQDLLTKALVKADPNFPDGPCVTNIDTAMEQAAAEPAFSDTKRKSFAILITDGAQSACKLAGGDAGTTKIITDMAAKGIGTFVIGFGSGIDAAQMNKFADAGGVPSGDPVAHYYKAEDQASLDAALQTIGKKTLSCTLNLTDPPPDPNGIYVFFNGDSQVAKDVKHVDGWDYDAAKQQVHFYGASCTSLQTGSIDNLDIVFGCPGGSGGAAGAGGNGGSGGAPPGCESGTGCSVQNLCPDDPAKGAGLCQAGCCVYGKQ